jgi:hypothetical protein
MMGVGIFPVYITLFGQVAKAGAGVFLANQ